MNKILEIALAKLRPFSDTNQWCACLSYAEIIALYDNGYRESCDGDKIIKFAKEEMKRGVNRTTWVYWNKIGKNKPHYNRINISNK